jgi:hypothetical protein
MFSTGGGQNFETVFTRCIVVTVLVFSTYWLIAGGLDGRLSSTHSLRRVGHCDDLTLCANRVVAAVGTCVVSRLRGLDCLETPDCLVTMIFLRRRRLLRHALIPGWLTLATNGQLVREVLRM